MSSVFSRKTQEYIQTFAHIHRFAFTVAYCLSALLEFVKAIMEKKQTNTEIDEDWLEFFAPTEEDLARKFTDEELKELCIHRKCRVDLNLFNPMVDMANNLRRKGRLQNKSVEQQLIFLTRCVKRYQPDCLYSDEEIRAVREAWRREDKKVNIRLLEQLEQERNENNNDNTTPLMEIDESAEADETLDGSKEITMIYTPVENGKIQLEGIEVDGCPVDDIIIDSQKSTSILDSEFLRVNTESLLVHTQDIASQPPLFTQNIMPTQESNYSQFQSGVPCSSTQDPFTS